MIHVRAEQPDDGAAVRDVNVAAFPTADEADLVDALRVSDGWLPDLSLVAEAGGRLVGHLLLTRIRLVAADGTEQPILSLAPLAVLPDWQGRGVGSALVRAAVVAAGEAGEALIVVLGHPWFYPKFGFRPARPMGIEPPAGWHEEAWMALPLTASGEQLRGRARFSPPFDAF